MTHDKWLERFSVRWSLTRREASVSVLPTRTRNASVGLVPAAAKTHQLPHVSPNHASSGLVPVVAQTGQLSPRRRLAGQSSLHRDRRGGGDGSAQSLARVSGGETRQRYTKVEKLAKNRSDT